MGLIGQVTLTDYPAYLIAILDEGVTLNAWDQATGISIQQITT